MTCGHIFPISAHPSAGAACNGCTKGLDGPEQARPGPSYALLLGGGPLAFAKGTRFLELRDALFVELQNVAENVVGVLAQQR